MTDGQEPLFEMPAPPAVKVTRRDPERFNAQAAKLAAEEGMGKADRAARVQLWKELADRWLDKQSAGREIVADDLVRAIGLPDVGPSRNNVVGAWFSGKAKAGRIVFAGRLRKSQRVVRHGNAQRVWIIR